MFNYLKDYENILVTGPQRSGTRIASKIIAYELNYMYIDELDIGLQSLNKLFKILFSKEKVVIQAPHLSAMCHFIDTPSTAIVFMRRDLNEIAASQKRIGWNREKLSLSQYFQEEGNINKIKYQTWYDFQKKHLMTIDYFEIEYNSLKKHELWLDDRTGFEWNQTK